MIYFDGRPVSSSLASVATEMERGIMGNDPENTELATGFTVRDYLAARDAREKNRIADAINRRSTERYITPAKDPKYKHGFAIMAISCLMIEALESFRRGWKRTDNKGEVAFCYFFNSHDAFKPLRSHCEQFYKNVRCGILHQAETTGGWKITRNTRQVPFFDSDSLTINATTFLKNLAEVLYRFCRELKSAEWDSADWKNVVKKMDALCDNCRQLGK